MSPDSASPRPVRFARVRVALGQPSPLAEALIWIVLLAAIIGMRLYLLHLVPGYIWTGDSNSYAHAVFKWLDGQGWTTDGRRGPAYSALIALAVKLGGSMTAVIWLQHAMAALSIVAALVLLRLWFGRRALVAITLCGLAYAVYYLPLHLAQLVRNETILLFTGTGAFLGWALFLRAKKVATGWPWLALSGISVGLLTLTKHVYETFVPALCVLLVWQFWKRWPALAVTLLVLLVSWKLPSATNRFFNASFAARVEAPRPQDGILFYGRTAQFTKLDGGLDPYIKALIREDIIGYRAKIAREHKLDNNWIIYRSAVPRIRESFLEDGRTDIEVNRFCRQLALEAIREHPGEYVRQVLHDLGTLLFKSGRPQRAPASSDVRSGIKSLTSMEKAYPILHEADTLAALEPGKNERTFKYFHRLEAGAWLFVPFPLFLTSLLLPVFIWKGAPEMRPLWIAAAAVWFFNLVLLSTVGRPMDRYLIPILPIMFWTLSALVIWLWERFILLPIPPEPDAAAA